MGITNITVKSNSFMGKKGCLKYFENPRTLKMGLSRYFSAFPFDHIFERKLKFSAAKSKSGVASFREKTLFLWTFRAPETANALLDWGKKSRLSPTVELLTCSVQTALFLIENSGNSPNSLTPKSQLF